MTERDKQANTLYHLFSCSEPRADTPLTLPEPAQSSIVCGDEPEERLAARHLAEHPDTATAPQDLSVQPFLHVASLRDRQASPPPEKEQRSARLRQVHTRADAKRYLAEVRQKVEPGKRLH